MRYCEVLVTGGSGRLGRFLVDRLQDEYALTVLDVRPSDVQGVMHSNVSVTDSPDCVTCSPASTRLSISPPCRTRGP